MNLHLAGPALLLALAAATPAAAEPPADSPGPQPTDLVESAESRLVQIDLTVTGSPDLVARLRPDDLVIRVNLRRIETFQLDRFCEVGDDRDPKGSGPGSDAAPREPRSYLLYFDQPVLTLGGRQRALELAHQLIDALIRDGDRALVVSNGRQLTLIEDLTADPATLHAALERLERDRAHWDVYATEEESRIAAVVQLLEAGDGGNVYRATSTARTFQREELARSERNLRRLALTLSRLADLPAPKAALYFADALRSNPGEHYLSFFGFPHREANSALSHMQSDAFSAGLQFDRVIHEAVTQGLRFYTIEAQGLITPLDRGLPGLAAVSSSFAVASSSRVRHRDAQNALASLALETGGAAFLNGTPPQRIARRVIEDTACLYVASFDPGDLEQDVPLALRVRSRVDGVNVRARGLVVVQSPAARLTSRLLGAFALPQRQPEAFGVRAGLVPTGFSGGSYSALLQVSVPGSALSGAVWDLGASVHSRDKVRAELSGRVSAEPLVPLVLEREVRLAPGEHEIVAVAHETTSGLVLSERVRIAWPDPDARPASIGPISLLQPVEGAFVRDGEGRTAGALARTPEAVEADRRAALVALICRARRQDGPLRVERELVGEVPYAFPPLEFDPGDDRCVQIRDLLPAGAVRPGYQRYEVRLFDGGKPADEAAFEFLIVSPAP